MHAFLNASMIIISQIYRPSNLMLSDSILCNEPCQHITIAKVNIGALIYVQSEILLWDFVNGSLHDGPRLFLHGTIGNIYRSDHRAGSHFPLAFNVVLNASVLSLFICVKLENE